MNIKDMVKNKKVKFLFYREHELWYTTECGFEFPVPIHDVGTAAMNAEDKAILYMRWIRKHITKENNETEERSRFRDAWDAELTYALASHPATRIPEIKK